MELILIGLNNKLLEQIGKSDINMHILIDLESRQFLVENLAT